MTCAEQIQIQRISLLVWSAKSVYVMICLAGAIVEALSIISILVSLRRPSGMEGGRAGNAGQNRIQGKALLARAR